MTDMFDYIIVGAGSAGCVLANRLSRDPANRVLLLEAGPPDTSIWLRIPAGVSRVVNDPKLTWGYVSDPEPGLNDRRIIWPRGRTLGGSSSINGHVYMRGVPSDYDGWRDAGNPGWGWQDVLPYFKRSEAHFGGGSALHGGTGELSISPLSEPHPASQAFVAAARNAGIPGTDDFNGATQEGVGYLQFMLKKGMRASASKAFLDPVRSRPNLRIVTDAPVERIVLKNGRATGVVYRHGDGLVEVNAREVILSGGTINTPQLMMLSGIGPAEELARFGIEQKVVSEEVGRNLKDHVYAHYLESVVPAFSVNKLIASNWRMLPSVIRYLTKRTGLLTSAAAQVGLFTRSHPDLDGPDLQIQMRPFSMITKGGMYSTEAAPAVTASCTLLRPHSSGRVTLNSARSADAPGMIANYLMDDRDLEPMMYGLRLLRRIFDTEPLARSTRGEMMPGDEFQSDDDLIGYLRGNAQSMYHPVGTCRMGSDPGAVVDPRLRVRGVAGLRVVDASIMPGIPSGNTNAPTIMIAEKASDMILADAKAMRPR